jgi:hypothetical protein
MSIARTALPTLTALALVAGTATDADAQGAPRCAPRNELLRQLASVYREAPVAVGVADNGALLEILAATDGATWTVLVTRANGVSCVMLTGQDWQAKAPQAMAQLRR